MTTARQPVRWMCLCESPGDVPPRQIPAGAVWVRLDSGHPAPATAETAEQQGAAPTAAIPKPDYAAAIRAREGNATSDAGSENGFSDVT